MEMIIIFVAMTGAPEEAQHLSHGAVLESTARFFRVISTMVVTVSDRGDSGYAISLPCPLYSSALRAKMWMSKCDSFKRRVELEAPLPQIGSEQTPGLWKSPGD